MGRWGAGLYDDDYAADLKQSVAIIATIPASGDRLLEILLGQAEHTPELTADDDGATFWLVIADQFERRGIRCDVVVERALTVLAGLDPGPRRKAGLDKLAKRLRAPRPERKVPTDPKRPDALVRVGEVYAFPTMAGRAFATYVTSAADFDRRNFVPDGWGALVVVDQGYAFDWLPWCALASVSVDPSVSGTARAAGTASCCITARRSARRDACQNARS